MNLFLFCFNFPFFIFLVFFLCVFSFFVFCVFFVCSLVYLALRFTSIVFLLLESWLDAGYLNILQFHYRVLYLFLFQFLYNFVEVFFSCVVWFIYYVSYRRQHPRYVVYVSIQWIKWLFVYWEIVTENQWSYVFRSNPIFIVVFTNFLIEVSLHPVGFTDTEVKDNVTL